MRPEEARTFEELYALLPTIACKRHCHTTCGPIPMSNVEHDRTKEAGVDISPPFVPRKSIDCEALSVFNTCRVYETRPLICRIWGVVQDMQCPYGCVPERVLSPEEGRAFIAASLRIGKGEYGK